MTKKIQHKPFKHFTDRSSLFFNFNLNYGYNILFEFGFFFFKW